MNYKLGCLMFILAVLIPLNLHGFPQRSDADSAIQDNLTDQINESPNDPHLRFELAMEYASTGWIEIAWDQLKLVPKLSQSYQDTVYEKYSQIIKNEPENWQAHFRLAFAYYFKKEKEKAIESFKTVLSLKPNHVWSMGFIALIYGEQKNYNECIKWCKRGLKLNNDATAIHFLIGKAYYETGNYFGVLGESLSVARLKSIEAKYRPIPPIGITE